MFENEKNIPQKHKISDVMDLFTYGIYAIGSVRNEQPNFMIADWVLQISFNSVGLPKINTVNTIFSLSL